MSKTSKDDLSVAGPGSPISLLKFVQHINGRKSTPTIKDRFESTVSVIIDGSSSPTMGMVHDDPEATLVLTEHRQMQAEYYRDAFFLKQGEKMHSYLYRYMHYMFYDKGSYSTFGAYDTLQTLNDEITKDPKKFMENDEWKYLNNMVKYCDSNKAAAMVIGMVQLVGGTLKQAKQQNASVRFFIENPEVHLHPKQERKIICLLKQLHVDYGLTPEENEYRKAGTVPIEEMKNYTSEGYLKEAGENDGYEE